jgi:uncharacterized paraquat-inducible protein A
LIKYVSSASGTEIYPVSLLIKFITIDNYSHSMKDYEVRTPVTQFDEIRGFKKMTTDALCKSFGAEVYYPTDIDSERREKAKQRIRETADTGDCLTCGAKITSKETERESQHKNRFTG